MINQNINELIDTAEIVELQIPTGAKVAAAGYVIGGGPVGAAAAYGLYKAYQELQKKYAETKDLIQRTKIKEKMDKLQDKIHSKK